MDSNLQKQEIKKSFTFDTTKKTDLYDSVFSTSLYTVNKEEEVKQKDYKERINELREREKLMGRNSVSVNNVTGMTQKTEKKGRVEVMGMVEEFKEINENKMSDLVGTEASVKFYDKLEDEEAAFRKKLTAFDAKELLKNASYTVKGKKAKRTKHSPSMQAVIDRMDDLQQVLSWKVAESDDLYDAQINSITSILRQASLACSEYLGTHNSSRAEGMTRKAIVQMIYDQISKESVLFEKRANEFKTERNKLNRPMWVDVFADIRREKIVPGNGVTITRGGAGTSDLIIVEKDGVKHYLKREEKMPGFSGDEVIESYADSLLQKKKLYEDGTSESLAGISKDEQKRRLDLAKYELSLLQAFKSALKKSYSAGSASIMSREGADVLLTTLRKVIKSQGDILEFNNNTDFKKTQFGKEIKMVSEKYAVAKKAGNEADMKRYRDQYKIIYNLVNNIYKSLNSADIATNAVGIKEGDSISKRNVATSRLAEYLKLGGIVAKSEMKDVVIDGENHRCIEMEDAGSSFTDDFEKLETNHYNAAGGNPGKVFSYSEECLEALTSLQVFDVIAGQTDRHRKNYTVDVEYVGDTVVMKSVKGIDNDMCFGTLGYDRIKRRNDVMKCNSIEDTSGNMTIPAMSAGLANRILSITPSLLDYLMGDLLNKKERDALKDRFRGVQNAIRRQKAKEDKMRLKGKKFVSKFIKDKKGWSELKASLNKDSKKKRTRNLIGNNSYLSPVWCGNKIERVIDEDGNSGLKGIYNN